MRAAVLLAPGQPMAIADVSLADAGPGEILVRLVATGVCHTDLGPARGERAVKVPAILGHEGAGVVETVGPLVSNVAAGDHVILTSVPRCGMCAACVAGKPWICETASTARAAGTLLDGASRLSLDGQPVHHFFSQSSFAERAVVPAGAAVVISKDVPLDKVAVLACGVSTGLGTVFNAARVEAGAKVVVVGCGGVGLAGIIACDLSHASAIVAVDLNDEKLQLARSLGATHTVNASQDDPLERVRELTGKGADYT
ncbi:MAG: alcohol dehydrogenase catalytic domain-containing protein, partial [Chloroflexota bacterium]